MTSDDPQLIQRWRQGDEAAAAELVRRYYSSVLNLLHRLGAERPEAEDITQECFLRLTRGVGSGLPVRDPRAWLYRCAINLWRDRIRRRMRLRRKGMWPAAEVVALADEPAPEETEAAVEAHWRQEAVQAALQNLSPAHREALVLYYFDELSYEDIARVCRVPVGTVRSRLHYAVRALRRYLGSDEEGQ